MNNPPDDRTPIDEVPQEDPAEQERPTELADRFAAAHDDPDSGEEVPSQIGPYRVLEPLGRGAFGNVYLCQEKEAPRRKLAVKVIRAGMDTREVLARFEAEKNAMFLMDHPSIARVIGAGSTDDEKPYFAMEYVPGQPISRFCSAEKLSIDERLRLFGEVCRAIQHAHAKAVVHRDLKPSNILAARIDGKIQVKIIDFGMVKSLQQPLADQTLHTMAGQAVGTFEYMSPEQARSQGGDVDTRTDIYALGAVLYELLTGELAFAGIRKRSYEEILKVISEQDPPRPSLRLSQLDALQKSHRAEDLGTDLDVLRKSLGNELDWVVMKALEKDRDRRYQTAQEMAAEIDRYLSGDAIEARPPSAVYRLKKTMRRHRGVLTATMVVFLALIGGMTWALIERDRAAEETDKARSAAEEARVAKEEAQQSLVKEHQAVEEAVAARNLAEQNQEQAELARREVEHYAYVANIQMAATWLDRNEPGKARARLDDCPRHLRNWEWGWLDQRLDSSLLVLQAGYRQASSLLVLQAGYRDAAFSPDGTRILIPNPSRLAPAQILDANTGEELLVLRGHRFIQGAVFSPDGTRIVALSGNSLSRNIAWVIDANTGENLHRLWGPNGHRVTSAVFNPEGTRIVTTYEDNAAWTWDVNTGERLQVLRGHTDFLLHAAFSPDGTRIVTAAVDGTVRVWDANTGENLLVLKGHAGVISAAFSPDGTRILTATGGARLELAPTLRITRNRLWELVKRGAGLPPGAIIATRESLRGRVVRVWDAVTGDILLALDPDSAAAFSPDGTFILTLPRSQKTVHVWNANTGERLHELQGHTDRVHNASFSPDSTRIVTTSEDNTARVWDVNTGESLQVLRGHTDGVRNATFSPDSTRILTASKDNTARVWDANPGGVTELATMKGHGRAALQSTAFSPDGTRIVTASKDGTARVWDMNTGESLHALEAHPFLGVGEGVKPHLRTLGDPRYGSADHAVFSPDGTRIVTASDDGVARIWDASTGERLQELRGHRGEIGYVAFSPDGTRIVTASEDNTARVWQANTGENLHELQGHTDDVHHFAFSPDGARIVTASKDETARVWDVNTGENLLVLEGHTSSISAVFSPDSTRILTRARSVTGAVQFHGTIAQIWDAQTGKSLQVFEGHSGDVRHFAFSPDGTLIVTTSDDETARIWDAQTGRSLQVLEGLSGEIRNVTFSPDGTRIVTASSDGTARVWDVKTGASLIRLESNTEGFLVQLIVFSPDGTRLVMETIYDFLGNLANLRVFTQTGEVGTKIHIYDSVPYRERYPAIVRARQAAALMKPMVLQRLADGEEPPTLRRSLAADSSLTREQLHAGLAAILAFEESQMLNQTRENQPKTLEQLRKLDDKIEKLKREAKRAQEE